MNKLILLIAAGLGLSSSAAITLVNESKTDTLFYSLKVPGKDWGGWETIEPGVIAEISPRAAKVGFKYFDGDKTVEVILTDGEKYLLQGTELRHRVREAPKVVVTPAPQPIYYHYPQPNYYHNPQPQFYYPAVRRWRR